MNSLVLLLLSIIVFIIAYVTYGAYLTKKFNLDNKNSTPAHTDNDGIDYVPADPKVLLGHHFSSIAGAGPITGPILASVFGWIPVYLWIMVGCIFFGGVHDFGALIISVRQGGKSIGDIIKTNIGKRGRLLFNLFAYATLILVVAAFTDICASTFVYDPNNITGAQAGTASMLFILLAVGFGYFNTVKKSNLVLSSIVGIGLLLLCIFIGFQFPFVQLNKTGWNIVLIIYITLASVLPVWILLQPRDYLCSFLLYFMIAGAILGVLFMRPSLQLAGFTSFTVNGNTLFPFLFVTVACGAISGFHSLVSSGTTSKQLDKEKDAKLIGYGGMLIEGVVAVIALITVSYITKTDGAAPPQIFANGIATFMNSFGIPLSVGKVFVILSYSAFALTSLDTATRIGRYIFQELFDSASEQVKKTVGNMYSATLITVGLASLLLAYGYQKIWPIFGSSNQLLSALALLAITAWLVRRNKSSLFTIIPMAFMFVVTLTSLSLLVVKYLFGETPNYVLGVFAIVLFVLAIILIIEAVRSLTNKDTGIAKKA